MTMMKLSRLLAAKALVYRRRPAPGAAHSSIAVLLSTAASSDLNKQKHYSSSATQNCSPTTIAGNTTTSNNNGAMLAAAAAAGVVTTGLCLYSYDDSSLKEQERQHASCSISKVVLSSSFPNVTAVTLTRLDDDDSHNSSSSESFYSGILPFRSSRLHRHRTVKRLEQTSARGETLESKYLVNWKQPLGQGAFGAVYVATNRKTNEKVAVKKISKRFTDNEAFQREADALLHIRECGGHPNICGLRENYKQGDYFFLVLDLVSGGEMFDNLCNQGAYSEADAARMVREIASALAFMHGVGIVHCDMKPENLMLSTEIAKEAIIQIVDFGCAQVELDDDEAFDITGRNEAYLAKVGAVKRQSISCTKPVASTPAYSPPEALNKNNTKTSNDSNVVDPSLDMWAMGVILYIMLTGVHPFDLYGNATELEIEQMILSGKKPPLRNSPITAHLSMDAIALIEQLLQWEPKKRLTADQLLAHPWVRGETARTSKMADSDKRLAAFRTFKTRLEAKVFAGMVSWTDNDDSPTSDEDDLANHGQGKYRATGSDNEISKRTSLIERSFQMLDEDNDGYVTKQSLMKHLEPDKDEKGGKSSAASSSPGDDKDDLRLSLSGFSEFLSDHMRDKYFPKGHVIYEEGDVGDTMFFLNSGTIEVYTHDGFSKLIRQPGDFFGEGALLHPQKLRSASIRCVTPVHAIEVNREYFEKYLANQAGTKLDLAEKDRSRKRHRAKTILRLQQNMKERNLTRGEFLFQKGDRGTEMYIVEEGQLDIPINGRVALSLQPGQLAGEHALFFDRPQNVSAQCGSDTCKVHVLYAPDFFALLKTQPALAESFREICYRREFRQALCNLTKKPFPTTEKELRMAFNVIDTNGTGVIELEEVQAMIKRFDPRYTEEQVQDILKALDLNHSGTVSWEEFKRIFRRRRGQLHM